MSRSAFFRARAGKPDSNAAMIVEDLRSIGLFVVSVRSSESGVPDLAVFNGVHWTWLEVKTETGSLNDAQVYWHEQAAARGIRCCAVLDLDDALAAIHSEGPTDGGARALRRRKKPSDAAAPSSLGPVTAVQSFRRKP